MAKSNVIVGIDPGTVITGYAVISVNEQKLSLIDFGCIRPPANKPLSERYAIIHDACTDIFKKHDPSALSIETQFVYRNPQSAIKLGMARGIVILAAYKNQAAIYEYTPKKVKVAATGNGNASKQQVQSMMQYVFRLPSLPTPIDAADALALTVCHAHALQSKQFLGARI